MHRFGSAVGVLLATSVVLAAVPSHHEPIFGLGCFGASVAAWVSGLDPRLHGLLVAVSLLVIADPFDWLFSAALAFYSAALLLWLCARRSTTPSIPTAI